MSLFDLEVYGEASLPEEGREEFLELLRLAFEAGEAKVHERWSEEDAGEDF